MSYRMYNILRFLSTHDVKLEYLKWFNQKSLWALFNRRYIEFNGRYCVLTELGQEVLGLFSQRPEYRRKELAENGMTERVKRAIGKRSLKLVKKAA